MGPPLSSGTPATHEDAKLVDALFLERRFAVIEERFTRAGAISYRAKVRLKGHPEVNATFRRLTDARKWKQDTESAIRDGRYFAVAEAKRHTLGELVDRYVNDVLPRKPKNGSSTKQQLLWWKSKLGTYALSDVGAAR